MQSERPTDRPHERSACAEWTKKRQREETLALSPIQRLRRATELAEAFAKRGSLRDMSHEHTEELLLRVRVMQPPKTGPEVQFFDVFVGDQEVAGKLKLDRLRPRNRWTSLAGNGDRLSDHPSLESALAHLLQLRVEPSGSLKVTE